MSVINGNIRYFAYYKNIAELKQDPNVKLNKLVTVITSNNVNTDYVIQDHLGPNGFRLDNGLYANPIFNGNAIAPEVSLLFTSIRPSDYEVGGLKKGDEFVSSTITNVLNRILNGESFILAGISDNCTQTKIRRGTPTLINHLYVDITSTVNPVTSVIGLVGDEVVAYWTGEVTEGRITADMDLVVEDTVEIQVKVTDSEGNSLNQTLVHEFDDPIFWMVCDKNYSPGVPDLESANIFWGPGVIDLRQNFSDDSLVVAVPDGYYIDWVEDENGIKITELFKTFYSQVYITSDYSVAYNFNKSRALTIPSYRFRIGIEKEEA